MKIAGSHSFEFLSLDHRNGKEHIIGWEAIAGKTKHLDIGYHLTLIGCDDVHEYQRYMIDVRLWWLPDYEDQGAISTIAGLKTRYDQRVVKTDDTDPLNAWNTNTPTSTSGAGDRPEDSVTAGDTDYTTGDTDASLVWRPDRISLRALTDPQNAAMLLHKRVTLGYLLGMAYRTSGGACRYTLDLTGQIGEIAPSLSGYLVWILTLPDDIPDNAWNVSDTMPLDNEWENIRGWQAPMWNPVSGTRQIAGNELDMARRWMIQRIIENNSNHGRHQYLDGDSSGTATAVRITRATNFASLLETSPLIEQVNRMTGVVTPYS